MDMLRGGCTDPQGFFDEWSHLPVFDDDLVRRLRDTHWLLPHRGEVSRFAAELGVLLPGATRVHFSSSTEVFPVPARGSNDYADSGSSYPDPYEQVFKFYAEYTTMLREGGSHAQEFFDSWRHLPIFDLETANFFPESHWVNEHRKGILSSQKMSESKCRISHAIQQQHLSSPLDAKRSAAAYARRAGVAALGSHMRSLSAEKLQNQHQLNTCDGIRFAALPGTCFGP